MSSVRTLRDVTRRETLLTFGAGSLAAAFGGKAFAKDGPVSPYVLADFFQPEKVLAAALSPLGERIAVLGQIGTVAEPHSVIDVILANDIDGTPRRIALGKIKIEALEWANDQRLLIRVAIEAQTARRAPIGSNIRSNAVTYASRRLLSVDAVTGDAVVMFEDQRQRMRGSLDLGQVVDILPRDPNHVLMVAWERGGVLGLHKVNVNDGSAVLVERGNSGTYAWRTQGGVAVLRHDINSRGTVETVHARAPGETEWRFARRTRVVDAPDFAWVAETERPGVVLVSARTEGEDLESVREMDLKTLAFGPPMESRPGRDVLFGLRDSSGAYLGAAYYGDRLEYSFRDPALAPHHRAMNRFFDDDCDVYLTDVDTTRNRFISHVQGPREPGAWYFYDRQARRMVNIGSSTELDYERLGKVETLAVTTRDGARLEAYLTAPPSGRPGPLVVLPHGGPEVRNYRGWNRQVQVLAAQGWWVLQPNFRGSGGYGLNFARQGWTRWADRMQEDIEDAVAQAIASRGLDGDRVAIMGTSYGGYAALMGAVRRPELYKAAISICGVSDLPDILAWEKRTDDTPGQEIYEFWTKRIGVPGPDDARLVAGSPRRRVSEIACPVLLVHGTDDAIVPVLQSRQMSGALRSAGKTAEFIEVNDAGHADWEDDKEQELMGRYVALLARAFA